MPTSLEVATRDILSAASDQPQNDVSGVIDALPISAPASPPKTAVVASRETDGAPATWYEPMLPESDQHPVRSLSGHVAPRIGWSHYSQRHDEP
jgi:hypothetical protein